MRKYSKSTIYLSSYAKLPNDMPSGEIYGSLDVGLIINYETNEIEDISMTLITDETKAFLKQILVGLKFGKNDFNHILQVVKRRFAGSSQKALCVNLKLIHERYLNYLEDISKENTK